MSRERYVARIEAQFRAGMSRGSRWRRAGGFDIFVWPVSDPFYRDRASPVEPAALSAAGIDAMVSAWGDERLVPRVEHVAEGWPGLDGALMRAGFRCEQRLPIMVAERVLDPSASGGARLLTAEDPALAALMAGVWAAFGVTPAPGADELTLLRREMAAGGTRCAVAEADGQVVAGATLVVAGADAELTGVWTEPGARGRGHATAVCVLLLERFLTGGGLVWLAADGRARRLYRRLGFTAVATLVEHALPPA